MTKFKKDSPLLPSGLLGPVVLLAVVRNGNDIYIRAALDWMPSLRRRASSISSWVASLMVGSRWEKVIGGSPGPSPGGGAGSPWACSR